MLKITSFVSMPLIESRYTNIHIWENKESSQELQELLQQSEVHLNRINSFKSTDRIKQYLTNRLLIQEVIGVDRLIKGPNNKPYLEYSSLEVSFSHNKNYTLFMTSDSPCGIDIQSPTEKVIKVKDKFVNDNDFCFKNNDLETLSKVWSCKEAAFKKFGDNEIYLKSNITVLKQLAHHIYEVLVTFNNEKHVVLLKEERVGNDYLFFTIN